MSQGPPKAISELDLSQGKQVQAAIGGGYGIRKNWSHARIKANNLDSSVARGDSHRGDLGHSFFWTIGGI